MAQFAQSHAKALRSGLSFEVIPSEAVKGWLPQLKAISDAWLENKQGREKGFSVGQCRAHCVNFVINALSYCGKTRTKQRICLIEKQQGTFRCSKLESLLKYFGCLPHEFAFPRSPCGAGARRFWRAPPGMKSAIPGGASRLPRTT